MIIANYGFILFYITDSTFVFQTAYPPYGLSLYHLQDYLVTRYTTVFIFQQFQFLRT